MQKQMVEFRLNGQPTRIESGPLDSLAQVLREQLGMTGTKLGCEAGDCGLCNVLVDGRQSCACLLPIAQCRHVEITTIESDDVVLDGLRQAFLRHAAAQCGICTPGMLISAADLLRHPPQRPLIRADVEQAIGGTLCRCTGYIQIIDAILDAAHHQGLPVDARDTPPAASCIDVESGVAPVVGQSIVRVDGVSKVLGQAVYAADTAPPGSLLVRIIRSPYAAARFILGNLREFRETRPGLHRVLTAADIPGCNGFGIYPHLKDQPVLAQDEVRYRGDPVLALVGEADAVLAIDWQDLPINWQLLEPILNPDQALAEGARELHAGAAGNVLIQGRTEKGDISRIDNAGLVQVRGQFRTGFVEHAYLEPEAGYAQRIGDRVEIFATTQAPMIDLDEVAGILGIDKSRVRIMPSVCGGGFGGKLDVSVQAVLAVAAWVIGRPVRIAYNRTESMASSTKRHPASIEFQAAADHQGRLQGVRLLADFDTGAYASWGPTVAGRVPVHCTGPYRVPNVDCRTRAVLTNNPPCGAFRGFGTPQSALARELGLDELADKLGLDRWQFRYLNAFRAGDSTPSGQILDDSVGMQDCLQALEKPWQAYRQRRDDYNTNLPDGSAWRRGIGIACMWYGCGNTGLSNPSTLSVALHADGRLVFHNGAVDIGQGSNTVLLQICADACGLPAASFDYIMGDTDLTADAGKTSASRQTFVSGKAAMLAGRSLRAQLLALAGLGDCADDASLSLTGDSLHIRLAERDCTLRLADVADEQGIVASGSGTFDPPVTPLDDKGQGRAYATYAFAAQICIVDVHLGLGQVRVREFHAAHDVGRAINPALINGQIIGGIVQGMGMALMEEYLPGRTENLHDYLIPTAGDIPEIEITLIEHPEPLGPYGAKGVGEPALVPTPAAILSAIRDATGVTMRQVPVLPHRLLEAIRLKNDEAGRQDREANGQQHSEANARQRRIQ